jgi:putative ABC transport system permease protein
LWQDVRFGFRTLWKSRGFTAVIVLTLALGIGANTAIFSVVNGILLRALPYEDPDRLVTLWEVMERGSDNHVSLHNFLDWQEQSRSFAALAVHPSYSYSAPTTILGADAPTRVWVADVSRDFFAIFQARPALGRWPFAEEFEVGATQTAVVSYRFWQNQLGATPAFNERVLQIGSMSVPVVGVMPPGFSYPKETDVWVTTDVEPYPHPMARTGHNWAVIARLRDGVSLSEARTEMNSLAARLKEQWGETNDAVAVSVTRLQDELVGSYKRPLYLLLGAAGLVLLVACANIASTLMARGTARARELAVRASLGAGRRRLVRQLFTESLLLSGLGTAAGIVLAVVVLRGLLAVGPAALAQTGESGLDARAMIFALAVAFVASVVFGLFPAFRASKTDVTEALSSVGRGNAGAYHRGLWSFLVGSEVALAVLLLVGSGLLIKSFWEVLSVHPGFDTEDLLTVQVSLPASKYPDDQSKAQFHQAFLQQIAETPGVTGAGIINHLPLSGVRMSGQFLIEGRVDEEAGADYRIVDRGYFGAMGIPVVRGRVFDERDHAGVPDVVVINQTLADRYWANENPVGKRIRRLANDQHLYGDRWLTIIGVVGDVRHRGLTAAPQRELYVHNLQRPGRAGSFIATIKSASTVEALVNTVRARLEMLDGDVPAEFSTMTSRLSGSVSDRRFTMVVLGAFGGVALLLAMVGIYGVVSYAVARRTREMGIRLALGAEPGRVRNLVQLGALRVVAIGMAAGVAGAFFVTRIMQSLLFDVSPTDPVTFGGVVLLLFGAAWVASFVPARRSTRIDPMITMRAE